MRNRALHEALRDYALEAAAYLTNELRAGAEIAYDVVEERRGGSTLYSYRALTDEFIRERWDHLRRLPACAPAARTLGSGAEIYLKLRGESAAADEEEALRAMLERLYRDATGFDFPERRFETVYAELELALYRDALRTAIVAPLHELALERERIDLGDGLFLIAGDKLDAPEQAVWEDYDARPAGPNAMLLLRRDIEPDAPLPLAEARERFAATVRALRLLGRCGVALGPLAFGRVDDGRWQPLPLGLRRRGRGPALVIGAGVQPELCELAEIARRRPAAARISWALERFELGLDQPGEAQALPDYVLALEALFDATDNAGRASMPVRIAALCADDEGRQLLRSRVERAVYLEEQLKSGRLGALDDDERRAELVTVTLELEDCLRALLRDVLCGYLDQNLPSAADDILIASGEAVDIRAADLRAGARAGVGGDATDARAAHSHPAPETSAGLAVAPHPPSPAETHARIHAPPPAVSRRGPPPPPPPPVARPLAGPPPPPPVADRPAPEPPPDEAASEGTGVTASDDWAPTEQSWDDPADFSAPV